FPVRNSWTHRYKYKVKCLLPPLLLNINLFKYIFHNSNLPLCPLLVVVLQNFCKGEIRFNRCYLCTSLCKRNGKTTRRCSNIQNGISFKYYSLFFQPTYNSFCTLFSLFAKALIIILLSGFVKGTFRNRSEERRVGKECRSRGTRARRDKRKADRPREE